MNTLNLVRDFASQMNNSISLPWIARASFQALSVIHLGWWWFRKGKLYTQQKNILPLAIGHGMNYFVKIEFLRFGAKLLLIITRAEECWKQTSTLGRSYRKLENCLVGRYSFVPKPVWSKSNATGLFSICQKNWGNQKANECKVFAFRLAECAFRIFKHMGKLGMRFWDLFDSLSSDNEAMQEVVVNGMKWMDKVRTNQFYYIDKLRASKPYVEKIILYSNVNFKADEVIEGFVDAVNATASAAKTLNKVSNAGGGIVIEWLKRSGTLAGAAFGELNYLPPGADRFLILDETPQWSKKLQPERVSTQRFPKIQWENLPKKPSPAKKPHIQKMQAQMMISVKDCQEKKWPKTNTLLSKDQEAMVIKFARMLQEVN